MKGGKERKTKMWVKVEVNLKVKGKRREKIRRKRREEMKEVWVAKVEILVTLRILVIIPSWTHQFQNQNLIFQDQNQIFQRNRSLCLQNRNIPKRIKEICQFLIQNQNQIIVFLLLSTKSAKFVHNSLNLSLILNIWSNRNRNQWFSKRKIIFDMHNYFWILMIYYIYIK